MTQGFPLIHYDPRVPLSKDLIDAGISYVMANFKYNLHQGMDGKTPRFNIMTKKPTREKVIAERQSSFNPYPDLDELDSMSAIGGTREPYISVATDEGDNSASARSQRTLSRNEEADVTKELEIQTVHFCKVRDNFVDCLQMFFGIVRGNQTPESKEVVEKDRRWTAINDSKDGILLWLLVLRTHQLANQHQPDIAMSIAEHQYNLQKMSKSMNLLQFKTEYREKVQGLIAAGIDPPNDTTQSRHFINRLDLSRYGAFVRDLHNGVYTKPTSLEEAFALVQSKVSLSDLTTVTATTGIPTFTTLAIESGEDSTPSNGKRKNGKKGKDKRDKKEGAAEKKSETAKSESTKSTAKVSATGSKKHDEKSAICFGCKKSGHLLKDCPKREKVLAEYSKKKEEATSMTVVDDDEEHSIFMSWPIDEEDQDDDDMPALRDDESEVDDQEEDLETMPGLHSLGNVSEEVINDYNADQAAWESSVLGEELVEINSKSTTKSKSTIWQQILLLFSGVAWCVIDFFEAIVDKLSLAIVPLTLRSLLLDTGSNIHLTPIADLPGLLNVLTANPPFKVKGVGHGSVSLHKVGQFLDLGPMYIGKAPCTIISVGLATQNGAKIKWADDMSSATLTTASGTVIVFKRRKQVWICNDFDGTNSAAVEHSGTAMVTEAEKLLKYNRHELKQADEAAEYLKRLRYPGRGTAKSIVTAGALRNLPVTTKGLNVRFDIVGQELAAEQGGRRKSSPKLNPEIVNESIISEERSSILYVDLFFLNKFAFLLGAFYVPYSERAVYVQQFLSKGKGIESIVAAITGFVGVMRSNKVKVESIQCDMESAVAAAKPTIESKLTVKVQQIGDNVAEIERGIGSVKMVCRKVKASLPFNLYGILFVFLVAWAVSGLNLWTSPNFVGKLSPREALTGLKPDAAKELNASFCDYLRTDATNAEFTNNLDNRAVEAIALTPIGNDRGEWYCLSLETFRVITRTIRSGDIVPIPTRVINMMNLKAASWSQELQFSTRRGLVGDTPDIEVLQNVPARFEDRSGSGVNGTGTGNNSNDAHPMVGVPADIIVNNEDSSAGVQMPPGDGVTEAPNTDIPLQIVNESSNISATDEPSEPMIVEMDGGTENLSFAEQPTSTPTVSEPTQHRVRSPLPHNSSRRPKPVRGATKIDSLQSLTKSSFYVSKRKDDTGRAYSFHMSLLKGLRKHKDAGFEAMLKELMTIHETETIAGVDYNKLTPAQKGRTIRSMMFFKEKYKPNGMFDKLKARLVAGGHQQDRSVYSESDTSSPTVATEAVMMVAAIAARDRRHVVTIDIGGAFLRGKFKDGSDPVVMRLEKELADTLCAIDKSYEAYVRPDGSMYVKLTRPLYGLIEAAKLWFEEISSTLKRQGFVQNQYDQCTWNRDFNGHQHTVVLHVDDLKSTCVDDKANQQLIEALRSKYKDINVQEGLVHPYLGMTFDYSVEGKVKVTQDGYVSELIASEDIKSAVKTPASEDLFVIDPDSAELNKEAKEHFHSLTAKLLYLSKRTRPDILVAVSFLTSRVQVATEQDGAKLTRVLRYLFGTQSLGIVLEADEQLLKLYCYIDASFGVHADAKSHTGTLVTLGKGPIMAKSVKQKINTKSSTEAELVGLSDSVSLVIWCRNFLESQGYKMPPASVFQDNLSTIAMVKNGKPTSDRTRHVNIRFFFVRDRETNDEIRIEYKPTKQMVADIFTKALQGDLFVQLRNELMNITA